MTTASHITGSWESLLADGFSPVQRAHLQLAADTTHYLGNHPTVVWGDLQTPDCARAIFQQLARQRAVPAADIEQAVELRTARSYYLGRDGSHHHVLMGEAALTSEIFDAAVLRRQLQHLVTAIGTPGLLLGIIPATAKPQPHQGQNFRIYNKVRVELEGEGGAETVTDLAKITQYREAFSALTRTALYGSRACALIGRHRDAC